MKLLSFLAKFPLLIFILLLTLLNVNDYFHAGFPYTHDGENHLARFANYKVAVREGQIPPRFAPNLVNHYGYPVFNYNYPLANILSLPFSIAGVSYELTFKLLVVGFLVFGLWGMNEWLKSWQFKFYERWLGLVFFSLSPYLLTAIIYRGSIGEVMAMAFLPWLLRLVEQVRAGEWQMDLRKWRNWPKLIWPTLLFGLFFLSHNVAVLFGMGIILLYASLRLSKNWRSWLSLGGMILSGLALSLWFWLPALAEKSLVVLDQANLSNEFTRHFATWSQLLFAPLRFGFSYPGSVDGLSFGMGLLQWTMLLVALVLMIVRFFNKRSDWKFSWLWVVVILTLLLILFQLAFTTPLWQLIPLANYIQFPWRLTLFFSVLIVPVMVWVWRQTPAKGRWLWLLLLIIQLIGHWRAKPIDYFHRTNLDYDSFTQSSTTLNENTPVGYDYQIRDWQPVPSVLEEDRGANIQVLRWQGSSRHYQVQVDKPATIIEPTMNFAGWETNIKDKDTNQTFPASYINNDKIGG